ncbi:hypothetical protein ACFZBU_39650 [Embleya sp. NPDC008237]|uniref:hypothetical protein n=1 Tax=Embleya sp. NPDC008237 TaxID=3363978 RepID=UPI0036EABB44
MAIATALTAAALHDLHRRCAARLAARAAELLAVDDLHTELDDVIQETWAKAATRPWISTWEELAVLVRWVALETRAHHGIETPIAPALPATRVVARPLLPTIEVSSEAGPVLIAA